MPPIRFTERCGWKAASAGVPAAGAIWVGKDLASRLDLDVGERVKFGDQSFLIDGIVRTEPTGWAKGSRLARSRSSVWSTCPPPS